MLIGALLGIILTLLVFAVLVLVGKCLAYVGLNNKLNKELYDCQMVLGRIAVIEQARLKMKEDIVVNFTEEQITVIAGRISSRVKTILDSETQDALSKLS